MRELLLLPKELRPEALKILKEKIGLQEQKMANAVQSVRQALQIDPSTSLEELLRTALPNPSEFSFEQRYEMISRIAEARGKSSVIGSYMQKYQ